MRRPLLQPPLSQPTDAAKNVSAIISSSKTEGRRQLDAIKLNTTPPPEARLIRMLPKQSDFLRDRQTLMLGYGGGIGAGKTVAALIKAVMRCQRCPNALGLIARKDFPKLLDSILTKLWKLFPKLEDRYNGEE